jgi:hypothetical protein
MGAAPVQVPDWHVSGVQRLASRLHDVPLVLLGPQKPVEPTALTEQTPL